MNQVSLMGNVTDNLELKTSEKTQKLYTQFTLAINDYHGRERKTNFIRIVAFGSKAEILAKYLTKGRKLMVKGKLTSELYQNQEGKKQEYVKVILEDFEFVDSRGRAMEEPLQA